MNPIFQSMRFFLFLAIAPSIFAQQSATDSQVAIDTCGAINGRVFQDLNWTRKIKYSAAYFTNGSALETTKIATKTNVADVQITEGWDKVWADVAGGKSFLAYSPSSNAESYVQLSMVDWQRALSCPAQHADITQFKKLDFSDGTNLKKSVMGLEPTGKNRLWIVAPATPANTYAVDSGIVSWDNEVIFKSSFDKVQKR